MTRASDVQPNGFILVEPQAQRLKATEIFDLRSLTSPWTGHVLIDPVLVMVNNFPMPFLLDKKDYLRLKKLNNKTIKEKANFIDPGSILAKIISTPAYSDGLSSNFADSLQAFTFNQMLEVIKHIMLLVADQEHRSYKIWRQRMERLYDKKFEVGSNSQAFLLPDKTMDDLLTCPVTSELLSDKSKDNYFRCCLSRKETKDGILGLLSGPYHEKVQESWVGRDPLTGIANDFKDIELTDDGYVNSHEFSRAVAKYYELSKLGLSVKNS